MSQSAARSFERPFAEEEAASDHRVKIYKYMARLSADEPAGANEGEERAALEQERAAQRHPRWRDGGSC